MSRLGKRAIIIPNGTEVAFSDGMLSVKGKSGSLTRPVHSAVSIEIANGEISVAPAQHSRLAKALWGTYAAHVRAMVSGVNAPFEKKLEVQGIGYRAEMQGNSIKLSVGFSHPVVVEVPQGLSAKIEKNVITLSGIDKDAVGQFAAKLRAIKKPEPYKGKGIRYEGEAIKLKQGKKAAGSA